MYTIRPVTHTRRCGRCGARVVVTGTIGPSLICGACADRLLAVIWGADWPAMQAHLAGLGKFSNPRPEVPAGQKNRRPRNHRRAAGSSPPAR